MGALEMSHWQLLLTAPNGSAKSLGHLRGGAAFLPPTPPALVSEPWLRGSMRREAWPELWALILQPPDMGRGICWGGGPVR